MSVEAQTIRVDRASGIRGWMSPVELAWLASMARTSNLVVEIGSAWGRSTRALGDNCPGRVYAVDLWEGPNQATRELESQVTWDDNTVTQQYDKLGGSMILADFTENLLDLIETKVVVPLRMESSRAATCTPDGLDLVFIDGAHDEASVRADIAAWGPKIKRGGTLAGHDYSGVPWHQVKKVVDSLFTNRFQLCESIWWITV